MPVDIFPVIDIPVVGVVWSYGGLTAEEMEHRVVTISEKALSSNVNGISRIESESIPGIGLIRVYFQQGTDVGASIAQISAVCTTALRSMPDGMMPPVILQYNASSVPVIQVTMWSETLPEERIFDFALNFLRMKLFTIPGLSIPAPYGGKSRQINVDVDPPKLAMRGLSPQDIAMTLANSNLIVPAGTARIGSFEYNIALNSSPASVKAFNNIPVKVVGSTALLLGDIARVADSYADQINVVRINGGRATFFNILKKSEASTLGVVNSMKAILPELRENAPQGLNLKLDFDQSTFVKAAIRSVLSEAVISSILVSAMILVFLGSWRSVLVVCTSIPLAIFSAIIGLKLTGNTINIMTLGGLSLAIGMLVDDATVEVENIHRNRSLGRPLTVAILHGAQEIALPAIMATLAICIVFSPVILLTGPARFLFIPLALAVVFSMLASYVLSRTLVPLLSRILLGADHHDRDSSSAEHSSLRSSGLIARFWSKVQVFRASAFDRIQARYDALLKVCFENQAFCVKLFFGVMALTLPLPFLVGMDFFPTTDVGLMKLHYRAPAGTRIEETEAQVGRVERSIRKVIPAEELENINSMIGMPTSYNLAFVPTDNVGGMDAEILIHLKEKHHSITQHMRNIRKRMAEDFPGATFFFQPADIVSQVLNFGLSAPIDVQIQNLDITQSYSYARRLVKKLKGIPGAADVSIKQVFDYPMLRFKVDRSKAAELGLSQRDVSSSFLIALASSSLVSPSFYLNPQNYVNYNVVVKEPLRKLTSVDDLLHTPLTPPLTQPTPNNVPTPPSDHGAHSATLGNIATVEARSVMDEVNHYNVQRVVDVMANVDGTDLGSVVSSIEKEIKALGTLPPGMKIEVRGQNEVMRESFTNLGIGLILAMVLVYLLMVVLFQSWLDPFIVMVAVPGALMGVLWMLLLSGTTINVESFMGSIMAVGIAASNSILMVSFANEMRVERGVNSFEAAMLAGRTRLRPVMMTALAMILGMLPSALGLGEGGEQNAPLGRAVIGGLLLATVVTLFIVPLIYSVFRKKMPTLHELDARLEAEAHGRTFEPNGVLGAT